MATYAAYLRVSSEEQRERQSIRTQLEALNNYASANSIKLRHTFAEDGVSGSVPVANRPEGQRLLELARSKAFDTLLVFRMDRIARDTLDLLRTLKELEKLGVTVRSITEPFETGSPMGKMVITMLGSLAEMEKNALIERSYAGMRRVAGEGRWVGGRPPFGFKVENRQLLVNETEAAIVREMFDKYLAGVSTWNIAQELNARGVPVPAAWRGLRQGDGAKWNDITVVKILRAPVYKGEFRWNKRKTVVEDGRRVTLSENEAEAHVPMLVEPIVSAEDWGAAQEKIDSNRRFSPRNAQREYLLRGLIVCGVCGYVCVGGGGELWTTYTCDHARRRGDRSKCARPRVKGKELEQAVWEDLVDVASRPDTLASALRADYESKGKADRARGREEKLTREIDAKTVERGKVLQMLRRDVITEDEAAEQLREIEREREVLERERDRLRDTLRSSERFEKSLTSLTAALKALKRGAAHATPKERGEMIRAVVKRITLSETNEATISYLLPE